MKKRIVIIVDNPLRDLPACSLVAAELSPQFDVFLVSMSQAPSEIFRLRPDLVILNYLRVTNTPLARKLVQTGIPFSIMGTEDGVFLNIPGTNENSYTKVIIKDEKLRSQVQQYFVWGETLYNYLRENKVYREETLLCTGTPRTDFYNAKFKSYFVRPDEVSPRPMVLINTSFPINNPKFATKEEEVENAIRIFGYSRDFITNLANQQDLILKEYVSLIQYLSEKIPQADFLVRPHPFEKLDIYEKAFAGKKNIKVEVKDVVAKWIWQSAVMLHYESSTAIEASFAGIPAISLDEHKHVRPNQSIEAITLYARNFEEARVWIENRLKGQDILPEKLKTNLKEIERTIYYQVDGNSHLRIADAIRKWFDKNPRKRSPQQKLQSFAYQSFFSLRDLAKLARKGRLVPQAKSFSVSQVQEITAKLARINGKKVSVSKPPFSTAVKISSN